MQYSAGPLHFNAKITTTAALSGYAFVAASEPHSFIAVRRGSLVVRLRTAAGALIEGAGVTVTAGVKFRHNAVTGADGTLVLSDLGKYRSNFHHMNACRCKDSQLYADISIESSLVSPHLLEPQSYFVKPFLKEHSFSPSFATADLLATPDSVAEFTVTRVVCAWNLILFVCQLYVMHYVNLK